MAISADMYRVLAPVVGQAFLPSGEEGVKVSDRERTEILDKAAHYFRTGGSMGVGTTRLRAIGPFLQWINKRARHSLSI